MVRLGMDEQQQAAAEALQQAGAVLLPAFGAAAEGGQQQQEQQQEVRLHAARWAVEGAKYVTTDTSTARWRSHARFGCVVDADATRGRKGSCVQGTVTAAGLRAAV
jgi:hypothetical protein